MTPGRVPVDPGSYRAWLFDLDGVLTRTADVHAAAWRAAFDRFLDAEGVAPGFDPVDDYLRFVDGKPRADGVRGFLASRSIVLPDGAEGDPPTARTVAGIAGSKNELFRATLARDGVARFDGAVAFVRSLRAAGIATAVVSASENTRAVLGAAGITDLFDVCVDGTVVRDHHLAGKPAPDSYLEAARQLAVAPAEAAMVEDALVGVEAGRSGGFALVVGIGEDGHRADLLAHGADVVVADLADLADPAEG